MLGMIVLTWCWQETTTQEEVIKETSTQETVTQETVKEVDIQDDKVIIQETKKDIEEVKTIKTSTDSTIFEPQVQISKDSFARCLTQKWAIFYWTDVCPFCIKQKELFGESFEYINYVNCLKEPTKCSEANISKVPTWQFANKEMETGFKTFEELAQKTDCEL